MIKSDGVYDVAEECECLKLRKLENRITFANIPDAFKDIRLKEFVASYYKDRESLKNVIDNVKYWISHVDEMIDEGIGLYLYSQTKGSGKTRMAVSIANELIYDMGKRVRFVTSIDILNEIKAMWNRESREDSEFSSESQIMKYLNTTDVLVIDDFGTETHKDWMDDKFYQIINTRYVNRLVTIFTSNMSISELKYDDRINNRIREKTFEIHFPEESVREVIAAMRQKKFNNEIKGAEVNG